MQINVQVHFKTLTGTTQNPNNSFRNGLIKLPNDLKMAGF